MSPFVKDHLVWINDVAYRINRQIDAFKVQLENTASGEITTHQINDLLAQYSHGELLTTISRAAARRNGKPVPRTPARMDHMSQAARSETRRRLDILIRLENLASFHKSRSELESDILKVTVARGDHRSPHVTTIYRWRRQYLAAKKDVRALFCRFSDQGGKGKPRLAAEVEDIIDTKIDAVFLAGRTSSAEDVHSAVSLEINARNEQRLESEALRVPGLRTIQRRIALVPAYDIAVARHGQTEADRRFAHHLGARLTRRILELVEIDHSPVDILVVDENGVVCGRPTITVVFDRKSRCVLGFHLSLAGHGTDAVFAALRHALLPKTYLNDHPNYANLSLEWDCYGWFERLLMDNGLEFHSEAVADALNNLGIPSEFAASQDPNDKPFVERFLRSFNYCFVHRLPGTTLAKLHLRVGFKAEDDACITLEKLDQMAHVWICSVYHQRRHRGLEWRTPNAVWKQLAEVTPPQLKANQADLDIEFSRVDTSALQHYGIDLNTFCYTSVRLLTLRRMLPEHPKVLVKWPSFDAGYIFVWDPIEEEYFKVLNKDRTYAGLTVEQAKRAKKAKAAADPCSAIAVATGRAVVSEMVNEALNDKKLKTRRAGAKLANQTSENLRQQPSLSTDQVPADAEASTDIDAANESEATLHGEDAPAIEMDWKGLDA